MPKPKNEILNPYYLELLKFLVVFKLKNKLSSELSVNERYELAEKLNEYNTTDSLNRIFSQGNKRRQNFNKSNLKGLCFYVGYEDWDDFIKNENQFWATDFNEKEYTDLRKESLQKINKTILIRVLEEVEFEIKKGISDYFKAYIKVENENLNEEKTSKKLDETIDLFYKCIEFFAKKNNETKLMLIYKVAQNIDEKRYFFEDFELPNILKNELVRTISCCEKTDIDKLIENIENPLNKEIMRLYKNSYNDKEIEFYLKLKGLSLNENDIKMIRWETADKIFNQLKRQENENIFLQN